MSILTAKAPAKINLHLQVKNRRFDNFHELDSIFLALDFGDTLHFELLSNDDELIITMKAPPAVFPPGQDPDLAIPPQKNIISRAVSLYRESSGFRKGLKIHVDKQIPLGSGLGGGSSNAASALLALNTLAAQASIPGIKPLAAAALGKMGALLGSDVPFFLKNCAAARVSGRGEIINPLKMPLNFWIVLVKPGFSSDTAAAYRMLDDFRELIMSNEELGIRNNNTNPSFLTSHSSFSSKWPFFNDFLPVFMEDTSVKGAYQGILEQLKELGADFSGLSGAGSTCFGVFTDRERALKAAAICNQKWQFVKFTFPLEIGGIAV